MIVWCHFKSSSYNTPDPTKYKSLLWPFFITWYNSIKMTSLWRLNSISYMYTKSNIDVCTLHFLRMLINIVECFVYSTQMILRDFFFVWYEYSSSNASNSRLQHFLMALYRPFKLKLFFAYVLWWSMFTIIYNLFSKKILITLSANDVFQARNRIFLIVWIKYFSLIK